MDSAPEGHEGGNTRYSAQLVGYSRDTKDYENYYQSLAQKFQLDPDVTNTIVEGITHMKEYFKKYLGVDSVSFKEDMLGQGEDAIIADYPEFPGAKSYDMITVHNGVFDGALWDILRQKVLERSDKIDVWYSSPVEHILQTSNKTVVGAQIERDHVLVNVYAKNGVVLATGGFENNQQMIQDYIGSQKLVPLGGLYNKGKGIDLGHEAGANMWHMSMYSGGGFLQAFSLWQPNMQRAALCMDNPKFYSGSIFTVGDNGTRYFKEDQGCREEYVETSGSWYKPINQIQPYIVFDEKHRKELDELTEPPYDNVMEHALKGSSVEELAKSMHVDPEKLQQTIQEFNFFAEQKYDYAFHRDSETLTAFSSTGPYYAIPLVQTIGWSEGGPQRNSRAEIIGSDQNVIPHLYSAGELGSSITNLYQGGTNLANCLIFGKIAGQNAAQTKDDIMFTRYDHVASVLQNQNLPNNTFFKSDVKEENYTTEKNQYIGKSNKGIGDEIVVRITTDGKKDLKKVEVLKHSESDEYGLKAIKELPNEMVEKNTYDVDAVSGASNTTLGLKDAVQDALKKIK